MPERRANGEGSVYVDGRGRVRVVVTVAGKKVTRIAKNKTHGRQLLRELVGAAAQGRPIGHGSVTTGEVISRWRDTVLPSLDLAPPTVESYTWALNRVEAALGTVRLATLTPEHVEATFARWASEGTSRSSLIKIRSVLNRVLSYAERRGLAARNIAELVELPAVARRAEPGRALTVDQAKSLLSAAHGHRLEALFVTMLMLGLRPGEALGLSWHDVDLDHGIVHVRRSLKLHHGVLTVTDVLKTSRSRRSLDAPPYVIDALHTRRVQQAGDRLLAGPAWSGLFPGLVFTTTVGTAISLSNLRRDLEKLSVHAGLGRWHPHELRHSAASIMSASGVPIEQIADVLGHDGIRMTALVYRHAVTPTVSAARGMGDVLS